MAWPAAGHAVPATLELCRPFKNLPKVETGTRGQQTAPAAGAGLLPDTACHLMFSPYPAAILVVVKPQRGRAAVTWWRIPPRGYGVPALLVVNPRIPGTGLTVASDVYMPRLAIVALFGEPPPSALGFRELAVVRFSMSASLIRPTSRCRASPCANPGPDSAYPRFLQGFWFRN